ncbi:MAG: aminoglycoside phosphotransferase family protein [Acidimicrobiia bacterium]
MHEDEFQLDVDLVRGVIAESLPDLAGLPVEPLASSGTVHRMFRLGPGLVIRVPRAPQFVRAFERETTLLPLMPHDLPLAIPRLVFAGSSTESFPAPWSVMEWIEGKPLSEGSLADAPADAAALGEFVRAMRNVSVDGPISQNQRGRQLAANDARMRESIVAVAAEFDPGRLTKLWDRALEAPPWSGNVTWIHGDLLPGNLLVTDGQIRAVIDFGECARGNPTVDLLPSWWVFDDPAARAVFLDEAGADKAARDRAVGWALSSAAGALAYYVQSNVAFADQARQTLHRLVAAI